MKTLTCEQVRNKLEAEELHQSATERLPVLALEILLLALPLLVLLSTIDPSGFFLHKILLGFPLSLWSAWAIGCFCLGLSSDDLLKRLGGPLRLRSSQQGIFPLLGLVNCASLVGLLFLAG
jgi:hypothetical protein